MTVIETTTTGGDLGIFHSWLSLPRTEEFSSKALNYFFISNAIWFVMFFILGNYHPLPASFMAKLKKPYDALVLRHRLVCIYHGVVAWAMGMYWHVYINDRTCSK